MNKGIKRLSVIGASLCVSLSMLAGCVSVNGHKEEITEINAAATINAEIVARTKDIIEVEGLEFKDLNANGSLDSYEDWRLPVDERVENLLSLMTLEEKVAQMQHPTFLPNARNTVPSSTAAWMRDRNVGLLLIRELPSSRVAAETMNTLQEYSEESRLGIPAIISMDSVHGLSYVQGATVTPHNLGLAATRNVELVAALAEVARVEHLAIGVRMTLSPEADIATEPRWGRVMETFGEDPELVTEMVRAQIMAFQAGYSITTESLLACIKHFPGSGPQMEGVDMAPIVSSEETVELHLMPYYAAIEAGVASIMPYYSVPLAIDNMAALGSEDTLQNLLRNEMGFDGIIQTDWGMIWAIQQAGMLSGTLISEEEAIVIGVNDAKVDGIGGESIRLIDQIVELVGQGLIGEDSIDDSVRRILTVKFQMGIFENPYVDVDLAEEIVGSAEHQALSLQAALESMTLLKNDGTLPLETNSQILVAGLRAGDMDSLSGGWTSAQDGLNIYEAIAERVGSSGKVVYEADNIELAAELAKESDVAIVVIGEPSYMHSPPWGAHSLEITDSQQEMLEAIHATGTPIITVVLMGRPYILTWCDENTNAILNAYYPGPQGGVAIANVLFGDFNPHGKLPIQIPRDMEQVLAQSSDLPFDIENPLFDYGFGLSYGD